MASLLVVVEEAFAGRGKGSLVAPRITADRAPSGTFPVRVRTPDGKERGATATLEVAHIRGPLAPMAMLRVVDLAPADLPAGTEIFLD